MISVLEGLTAQCGVEMDLGLSWGLGAGEEEALGPRCGGPWVWGPAKQKSLCQCLRPHRVVPELSSGHLGYLGCRLGRQGGSQKCWGGSHTEHWAAGLPAVEGAG